MSKSLVFIHGIGLGEWIFQEKFVPYYDSKGYEVHTFNLPGHTSQSSIVERQRITLDLCVQYVENYLNTNVSSPCVIVGMSMGGAICQKLFDKGYSNCDLKGVVLLSPVPPTNNLLFTLRLCRKLAISKPKLLADFFSGKTNFELFFSSETLLSLSEEKTNYYYSKILSGFSRLEYEIFFQDLINRPLVIDLPLKIIGGEDDLLFSPEVTEFTASYYSQQADVLPGLGHMIPFEKNYLQGINAIDSFLKEVF